MPSSPYDAKGLMISAIQENNPVVYIDHRWLHHIKGPVPEGYYTVPIGPVRKVQEGADLTLVSFSYMTLEAIQAAERLASLGIHADILDYRALRPLDHESLIQSLRKTGRLLVVDTGWAAAGMSAEILALASEHAFPWLKAAPRRICLPDCPTPTCPSLANVYYPRAGHIIAAAREMFGLPADASDLSVPPGVELDKPNPAFTGPF
jgi:pyruvate dehydrogenase E1 component beta subunit